VKKKIKTSQSGGLNPRPRGSQLVVLPLEPTGQCFEQRSESHMPRGNSAINLEY